MIGSSGASFVTGAMICAPEDRVRVHDHPLVLVEPLLLQQDAVRHADLADVMEQAAPLERFELRIVDVHHPPDVDRDLLDPMAVLGRVRIALVDGLRERPDRLREHLAHLDEALEGESGRIERNGKQQRGPPAAVGHLINPSHEPRQRRQGKDARSEPSEVADQGQCGTADRCGEQRRSPRAPR